MATRRSYFIHSEELERYPYPTSCPFNTTRAGKVRKLARSLGFLSGRNIKEVAPQAAERVVLKKFHTARYLHALKAADMGKAEPDALHMGIGTPDCPAFEGMYGYSRLACGATVLGAELIIEGAADVAYNPSGGLHHAGPEKASGFCYMNDVALGCVVLAEAGKRVCYLDVDVHFGDGVAEAFYGRSDVLTISFHENPRMLFPGTGFENQIGTGQGKGYCVCVPLPAGTFDAAYLRAFNLVAAPLIEKFAPDVIVFQMGADALAGDPLAHLFISNNVYVEVIKSLLKFDVPILMTGGGGYNIGNTVRAWTLAWSVLSGADAEVDNNPGAGGVLLESTEWQGPLQDRAPAVSSQQRDIVEVQVERVIEAVKAKVFSIHGL